MLGHIRGAFAGATEDRAGAFEIADGGVLFLDEVGELPLALQGRLLRILEHRTVNRVGSLESRPVDVVVIASTVRDLRTETLAGRFRRDLFHSLASVELHVPALRDRKEDIPYLAAAFVHECAARLGKSIAGLTAPAEALLHRREWRANVRELRNAIERACLVADGDFIGERELTDAMKQAL
jgi:DNA-binding NtrC family response regulator